MSWYLDLTIVLLTAIYVLRCSFLKAKYEKQVAYVLKHQAINELVNLSKRLVIISCILSFIFLGINAWRSVLLFKHLGLWGAGAIILLVYFSLYAVYQVGLYHWYNNLMRFARTKEIS